MNTRIERTKSGMLVCNVTARELESNEYVRQHNERYAAELRQRRIARYAIVIACLITGIAVIAGKIVTMLF